LLKTAFHFNIFKNAIHSSDGKAEFSLPQDPSEIISESMLKKRFLLLSMLKTVVLLHIFVATKVILVNRNIL